jgi:Putative Flp pilus-assembly TadE/G-like/von Willebrand factor type A domain
LARRSYWSRLRKCLRAFARDGLGNVAIVSAIAAVPMIGMVGAAVDYMRMSAARAHVQTVLDSATMAGAVSGGANFKAREAIALKYFTENYDEGAAGHARPRPKFSLHKGVFKGQIEDNVETSLLGVMGFQEIDFVARSEVKVKTFGPAEVVLVLDYSSSMLDHDKWIAMRTSALKLVEELSGGGNNPDVFFGLVPFAGHVYTTLPNAYIRGAAAGGNWTNCTQDRRAPYNIQDTTPLAGVDDSKWGMSSYSECPNYKSRKLVIQPLTTDAAQVKQQLRDMRPYQGTHIALGLEFGRHVLSPDLPFDEGVAYDDTSRKKVMILLTDGEQTSDGWGPGGVHSTSAAEANTETMCSEAKNQGVLMITVGFDLPSGGSSRRRLQDCATSADYFFDARTNDDLIAAFDKIGGALISLPYFSR